MELPDFLDFTPVPVRAQRNSWAPRLQRLFVLSLARGAGPGEAARRLGRSRQSAYRLRSRPGGESFAAAWDRAAAFSLSARSAAADRVPGLYGLETILVPRFYRGRLIGFVQREDTAGAMRVLRQLDRFAARLGEGRER
jgi:hypothetical protein